MPTKCPRCGKIGIVFKNRDESTGYDLKQTEFQDSYDCPNCGLEFIAVYEFSEYQDKDGNFLEESISNKKEKR